MIDIKLSVSVLFNIFTNFAKKKKKKKKKNNEIEKKKKNQPDRI